MCVNLEKNSRDLGFSLEGGVGSRMENRPLTVQKIFQGENITDLHRQTKRFKHQLNSKRWTQITLEGQKYVDPSIVCGHLNFTLM